MDGRDVAAAGPKDTRAIYAHNEILQKLIIYSRFLFFFYSGNRLPFVW